MARSRRSKPTPLETFGTDTAGAVPAKVGSVVSSSELTDRMRKSPLDVGARVEIHPRYRLKRRCPPTNVVAPYVVEHASTTPNRVGDLLDPRKLSDDRGMPTVQAVSCVLDATA